MKTGTRQKRQWSRMSRSRRVREAAWRSRHEAEPGVEVRVADHEHQLVASLGARFEAGEDEVGADSPSLVGGLDGHRCETYGLRLRAPVAQGDRCEEDMAGDRAVDLGDERDPGNLDSA